MYTAPMTETESGCPRCGGEFEPQQLGEAEYEVCEDCGGVLIPQNRVIAFMTVLGEALGSSSLADGPIEPAPSDEAVVVCPDCDRPMTRFGYMESRVVTLDRCTPCAQVWIDKEELPTMVQLYARTHSRKQERQEVLDEWIRHLSAMVAAGNGYSASNSFMMMG